jgi:SAM-dependent methyltransferase
VISAEERWDLEVVRKAERYQKWILTAFSDAIHGDVLEVGAGKGNFTRWISPQARRIVALEPDEQLCAELQALAPTNVEARLLTLAEFKSQFQFDAVVMINVLEHIDDDTRALRRVAELLKPAGNACILVPAHQTLYAPIDARFGHFRRYSKRGLEELLEAAGLIPVSLRCFNPVGALGWLVSFRLLRRPRLTPGMVRLSERIAVPLGKALDRLGHLPFGQSIIAVAKLPQDASLPLRSRTPSSTKDD